MNVSEVLIGDVWAQKRYINAPGLWRWLTVSDLQCIGGVNTVSFELFTGSRGHMPLGHFVAQHVLIRRV